jgi:formylglycine-generating enzyme required for sulfatase activity
VLTGAVTTEGDWLSIEPAAFRCRAGETQQVRLSPASLKVGSYRQAVPVVSNAGETEVLVTLQVRFSLEPALVQIPAGEFLRGSPETDKAAHVSEKPQHQIFLEEYRISKNPVTNAQYAAFVQATRRRPPEHWVEGRPPQGLENHPVVNVSWYDAAAFCRWLAEVTGKPYRLPSEAEWEKAARGSEGQVYPWGNRWRRRRCNSLEEGNRGTTPVGAYSPEGDSPYGCTDMAGNVWEWVADWYASDYYTRSSVSSNPFGPASGASKALRGGSWRANAGKARSTNRYTGNPKLTSPEVGFRCVVA